MIILQTIIKINLGEVRTQNGNLETTLTQIETKKVAKIKEDSEGEELIEEVSPTEEEEVSTETADLTEIEVQIMEVLEPVKKKLMETGITEEEASIEIVDLTGIEVQRTEALGLAKKKLIIIRAIVKIGTTRTDLTLTSGKAIILEEITISEEMINIESLTTMARMIILEGMTIMETKIRLIGMRRTTILEIINVL